MLRRFPKIVGWRNSLRRGAASAATSEASAPPSTERLPELVSPPRGGDEPASTSYRRANGAAASSGWILPGGLMAPALRVQRVATVLLKHGFGEILERRRPAEVG